MRITVLGGSGGYPTANEPCSGFLVEQDGFRLVLDLGYSTLPHLLGHSDVGRIDAVLVSHGHPDHCADVQPLLRSRVLSQIKVNPLPLYAPTNALTPVLALDRPAMLAGAYVRNEFTPGDRLRIGPFDVLSRRLPHMVPNAGLRLEAGGRSMTYTGDCAPSDALVDLASDDDLLLAEATYVDEVPEPTRSGLSTAHDVGREARAAGVGRLLLTHLWPGTDPDAARAAAAEHYDGPVGVARSGVVVEL